jgi:DNA-binding transcriptional ArsR family regulator
VRTEPHEVLKTLSVETRVKIIEYLKAKGPLGAKKLAELLGITPAAVSQHLRVLRQAGLVQSQRRGYWVPYSVNVEALESCRRAVDRVCTCGCGDTCRLGSTDDASLEALKRRERELERELAAIRARIVEIDCRGK